MLAQGARATSSAAEVARGTSREVARGASRQIPKQGSASSCNFSSAEVDELGIWKVISDAKEMLVMATMMSQ